MTYMYEYPTYVPMEMPASVRAKHPHYGLYAYGEGAKVSTPGPGCVDDDPRPHFAARAIAIREGDAPATFGALEGYHLAVAEHFTAGGG